MTVLIKDVGIIGLALLAAALPTICASGLSASSGRTPLPVQLFRSPRPNWRQTAITSRSRLADDGDDADDPRPFRCPLRSPYVIAHFPGERCLANLTYMREAAALVKRRGGPRFMEAAIYRQQTGGGKVSWCLTLAATKRLLLLSAAATLYCSEQIKRSWTSAQIVDPPSSRIAKANMVLAARRAMGRQKRCDCD